METPRRRNGGGGWPGTCTRIATSPNSLNGHRSTFQKIDELSQKLLDKGTIARFADKGEDSKVVARLIERLREAVVCYQVSDGHTQHWAFLTRGADITTASDL